MRREIIWESVPWPGIEHLRLTADDDGVAADGLVVGVDEGAAFRCRYEVRCDAAWRVREVRAALLDGGEIHLLADGAGRWTAADGEPRPDLDGCLDLDIRVTPLTNTLPIRRLGLRPGESAELAVAYLALPALDATPVRQRYTRLTAGPGGGLYRYESLPGGFRADLPVDADGLVLDYPGLFRRVWSGEADRA
jgi:hypothetical protein